MESIQRSPKICSLCDDEFTVVYSTVESYATHLRSSDHLDKLKAKLNNKDKLNDKEMLSTLITREYHRLCICYKIDLFSVKYEREIFCVTMYKYNLTVECIGLNILSEEL